MRKPVMLLIVAAMVLTGCATISESRFNPINWFGQSRSEPVTTEAGETNPLIPRRRASIFFGERDAAYRGRPVGEVSELLVERRPGGAIIRVEGIADRVGPFDVRLTRDEAESDAQTLTLTLRALQQAGPRNTGPLARRVMAAVWITDQDLRGIRTIRVKGERNIRTVRR